MFWGGWFEGVLVGWLSVWLTDLVRLLGCSDIYLFGSGLGYESGCGCRTQSGTRSIMIAQNACS